MQWREISLCVIAMSTCGCSSTPLFSTNLFSDSTGKQRITKSLDSMIENGSCIENSTVSLDGIDEILVPKGTEIVKVAAGESLEIEAVKTMKRLASPNPTEFNSTGDVKNQMGYAHRAAGRKLTISTWGEISFSHGGNFVQLKIAVPEKIKVRYADELSGHESLAETARREDEFDLWSYDFNDPKIRSATEK